MNSYQPKIISFNHSLKKEGKHKIPTLIKVLSKTKFLQVKLNLRVPAQTYKKTKIRTHIVIGKMLWRRKFLSSVMFKI